MASRSTDTQPGPAPLAAASLGLLSLALVTVGAALAHTLSGGPPLIGIDDAAITRNYAENLANGHGFVYYVGGERVEGATSFLWTLLLAATYLLTPTPEALIVLLSGALSVLAVYAVLSLAALLARQFRLPQWDVVAVTSVGILGLPGFFFWSVFTMMEVALWSAALLTLVWRLARLVERPKPWTLGVIGSASVLPLIRPEGIAVALGLIVLAAAVMWRFPRGLKVAALGALASFLAVTGFRLAYFGYPVPNTFYAKVSADRVQDLIDGVKYVFSFVVGMPFGETLVLLWLLAGIWAIRRHLLSVPDGADGLLIAVATVFGLFATYAALGGDHFAYWRFLQPVTPLLPLVPALGLVWLRHSVPWRGIAGIGTLAAVAAAVFWVGIGQADFRQARFDLVKEFTLVEQGLGFGRAVNPIEPRPVLGVGPAGGIALAYDGPIRDLLGLNWVEMAHAKPVKVGPKNHAGFDPETFWKHPPDLIGEFNLPCYQSVFPIDHAPTGTIRGLYREERFRSAYVALRIQDGDGCWIGYGRREWVAQVRDPRVETVAWSDVTLIGAAPQ